MVDKETLSRMSREERIKLVESLFVNYPRFQEIIDKIELCLASAKNCADVKSMFIFGPAGAGKTTLIKRIKKRYPVVETEEGYLIPILSTEVPVPTTIRNLVSQLLEDLGDPIKAGTAAEKTTRLRILLRDCQVQLIIIDEFQHFVDRDNQKVLLNTANWLKQVMNYTRIPVVIVGLPYAEKILSADSQLNRRISFREFLDPFYWDKNENRQEIQDFLLAVDEALPLAQLSNLDDTDTAQRILYATDGLVFYIMELVRAATALAVNFSQEMITMESLSGAFEAYILPRLPKKENPFGESFNIAVISKESVDNSEKPGPKATSNRGRKRKNKRNMDDTLKP